MASSKIINENQLDNWVRGNAAKAQGIVVELVWRLICASCPSPQQRRFPLGDSIGQHGADGTLETEYEFLPFVPEGKSVWEIGTNVDARAKANRDYKSSSAVTPEAIRGETTFIFVTPLSGRRGWADSWKPEGIETWLTDKRSRGDWKDVRVLDGTNLIEWISMFPAVGYWLAGLVNQLPDDFDTIESHWHLLSAFGEPPPLIPKLFIINREQAAEKLKRLLVDRIDSQLRLDTRFPQHLKDFVSAYVASLPEAERYEIQNRVLIFDSKEALKKACSLNESHIFVADFSLDGDSGPQLIQAALNRRHAVVFSSAPGGAPHGNACELFHPRISQMKEALIKSGYSEERARSLTNHAGRDLSALLRLIQGLSAHPDWATQSEASDLAIAHFLGQWQEESEGDREAAEALSGKPYGEWIVKIRKAASAKSAPLEFLNGRWKFTSRYEPWLYLGKLIGPEVLERFEKISITVLSEADPRLELPKEKRFAVDIYGKGPRYSSRIREGIAETLSLLGSHGESLTACPHGQPQLIVSRVVRELLSEADSKRWASLDDVLPLLAEAAPDIFLDAVEDASEKADEPFSGVFAEEGDVLFGGGSFVTGLLWALESLAWSGDNLIRVCGILANLASIDPGGRWENRPINSLITILLPWLPQTTGGADKRHASLRTIARDHPDVAWNILLALLPRQHQTSMHTHRPKWRDYIPEDWRVGAVWGQIWRDQAVYADLALKLARNDPERLASLLKYYFRMHPEYSNFAYVLRERLQSKAIISLPDDQRLELWTTIINKVTNHRKYADSPAWAINGETLQELEAVADKIKPKEPEVRHKRLFSGRDFDLYEDKGNWEEQRNRLTQSRINALREILNRKGFDGLKKFWRSVEAPHEVGNAYGSDAERADDAQVLPTLLNSGVDSDLRFAVSYIWRRFVLNKWDWVDSIDRSKWSVDSKATFFAALPFVNGVWERVTAELAENESIYWKCARVHPERGDLDRIEYAIEQLINNNRPDAAIQCIWLGDIWGGEYSELALRALETISDENHIDAHTIGEAFSHLQEDEEVDKNRLAAMEIKFLGILNKFSYAQPRTLYRQLAESPDFFCQTIQLVYRSKKKGDQNSEEKHELDEEKKFIAERAYRLLSEWDHPPGLMVDRTFDGKRLHDWVVDVKNRCSETGHWDIASNHIGKVLFYAPQDSKGLWVEPVCELLNSKDGFYYREGLENQIFNSRGVHGFSGGKEEIELAEQWENVADYADSGGFSRLANTLRQLGKTYREEAKRSIVEHRERFD